MPGSPTFQISPLPSPTPADFTAIFTTAALSLGRQTHDFFWTTFNPGYETDAGIPRGAEMLRRRWDNFVNTPLNASGERNAVYAVATVPRDPSSSSSGGADGTEAGREIVGVARWLQLSLDPQHGIVPAQSDEGARKVVNVEACAPGDAERQAYLAKLYLGSSLQRVGLLQEVMEKHERGELNGPPAVMALDLCAVRPDWQGKGVGKALVQWGMQQARERGSLESITEASLMGRRVYAKFGYREVRESVIDVGNGEVVRTGVVVMKTWESPGDGMEQF